MIDAFPLRYETWYAATLFLDAGHPREEILRRIGLDETRWKKCSGFYSKLHYANMSWVHSSFEQDGLPSPEDPALYARLTAGGSIVIPSPTSPPNVRAQLKALRRKVEADPHIGPFADVDWIACYIGERSFPPIRYVHDGRYVSVSGRPLHARKDEVIEGIDPHTFRLLGDRWFRDAKRVYCQGETPTKRFWYVVRGADPDSFEVMNERYARDKAAGYYCTGRRFPTAEPGTFEIVGYHYGRGQKPGFHVEESHYAKDSRVVFGYGKPIEGAHAPSFQAIGDEGVYFADINRIYYEIRPIEAADRESFTCASKRGQYCAFDKNHPYYAGRPLSVAEEYEGWGKFFEARPELVDTWWHRERDRRARLAAQPGEPTPLGGPYFSGGERVLVRSKRDMKWISLDHFDLRSFRHIVDVFAADQRGLRYFVPGWETYGRDAVKGADPMTFEALGDHWYRDAGLAYYFKQAPFPEYPELRVVKADMPTFRLLGGAYARDARGLICAGVRKREIEDVSCVVGLGFLYARMGDRILYKGKVVPKSEKIDVKNARGVWDNLLIDRSGHMLFGKVYRKPVPGVDAESLSFLNRRFAIDRDRVYVLTDANLVVCDIADRASVEAAEFDGIRDKSGRIYWHDGVKRVES